MKPLPMASLQADWPLVSALLDEALALPPAARAGWLAGLRDVQAAHRDMLRELLATQAEIETGDFLAQLPRWDPPVAADAAMAGRVVGPYRLVRRLGHGGMASVWLAERADGTLRRPVALKLPERVWGDAFAARLRREREILAALTHEHIARLYDAGVDAHGRPYLAMQFVDGVPIDEHCRQLGLPLAARVALLLQVMAAVAHAHSRLVVHRDLKPANILVDPDGRAMLLDFGIAKLLAGEWTRDTALTRVGGHALTPDYASPEQVRGEPLGTATDVYSLGMVAYELLTGRLPYRLPQAGPAELVQAMSRAQVPPPSSVAGPDVAWQRQLRGDLDAILGRALQPDVAQRYASVEAFAQDLRRWRDGEPVQARPDGLVYRATKFVRRHRVQTLAGTVAVSALLTGAALAGWQAHRAGEQARRATTEAAIARSVQAFLASVFLVNSGHQLDPDAARRTTARELLDRGAERIGQELAGAPEAQLQLLERMQEMYVHMALNDRAAALQRRMVALAAQVHGAASPEAVSASVTLAKTLIELNARDEARSLLLQAERSARAGPAATDTWLRLTIAQTLAFLYINEAPEQALDWARQAAALAPELPPSQETINAFQMLGETSFKLGHLAAAEDALRSAQAQIEQHPQAGEGGLPLVLATLGATLGQQGRREEAEAVLQRAEALAQRLGDPYSTHLVRHKRVGWLLDYGLPAQAVALARTEAAWAANAGAGFGALPWLIDTQLARALQRAGDAAGALRAIEAMRRPAGPLPPDLQAGQDLVRADALCSLGRLAAAQAAIERALAAAGPAGGVAAEARQVQRRVWAASGQGARALANLRADPWPAVSLPTSLAGRRRQNEEATLRAAAGETPQQPPAAAAPPR